MVATHWSILHQRATREVLDSIRHSWCACGRGGRNPEDAAMRHSERQVFKPRHQRERSAPVVDVNPVGWGSKELECGVGNRHARRCCCCCCCVFSAHRCPLHVRARQLNCGIHISRGSSTSLPIRLLPSLSCITAGDLLRMRADTRC